MQRSNVSYSSLIMTELPVVSPVAIFMSANQTYISLRVCTLIILLTTVKLKYCVITDSPANRPLPLLFGEPLHNLCNLFESVICRVHLCGDLARAWCLYPCLNGTYCYSD